MIKIDLTGMRFEHLTVLEYSPRKTSGCKNTQWLCQCDCGRQLIVRGDNLLDGRTIRCSECRGHTGGKRSVFAEGVVDNGVV